MNRSVDKLLNSFESASSQDRNFSEKNLSKDKLENLLAKTNRRNSKSEDDLLIRSDRHTNTEKTDQAYNKALQIALENKLTVRTIATPESTNREEYSSNSTNNMVPHLPSTHSAPVTDENGLIVPKKIINPCLESADRKNLHKELTFNQKIGKSVLNQKSELQQALERQKDRQHMQENTTGLKDELGRIIMERAERTEKKNFLNEDIQLNPEYLNARAKLRTRFDT